MALEAVGGPVEMDGIHSIRLVKSRGFEQVFLAFRCSYCLNYYENENER